ncbi:MAG TPA: hypothetical protein VGR93_12075 [Candidatus Acidoferrales bacterium]|nr:hypothetical protein [Candidatus Acidoferrales bacterium]
MNTPQFSRCRTRLPRHPQPAPPIYQPEVAAEAIVWAVQHRRREVNVGVSTDKAIWANKVAPGALDWYLGRTGTTLSKRTKKLASADRTICLSRFQETSEPMAPLTVRQATTPCRLWGTTHRGWISVAASLLTSTVIELLKTRKI